MTPSPAFITHVPAIFRQIGSGCNTDPSHCRKCPLRSSAEAPPPPPPSSSGSSWKSDGEGTEGKRARLEKMLNVEMKTREGHDGKCACIWCDGTKQRRCSWCEGKGVRHEMVTKSWEELSRDIERIQSGELARMEEPEKIPVRCSACSGSKKLRCAYCRGSGVGSYGHAY